MISTASSIEPLSSIDAIGVSGRGQRAGSAGGVAAEVLVIIRPGEDCSWNRYCGDLLIDSQRYSKIMAAAGYLKRWDYDGGMRKNDSFLFAPSLFALSLSEQSRCHSTI